MRSKGIRDALLIVLALVILAMSGMVVLNRHLQHIFGPSYYPTDREGFQRLLQVAGASRPLRDALEQFKRDHGSYPTSVTNLFFSYLTKTNTPDDFSDFAGWDYHSRSFNEYELRYKVNWDDAFWYECNSNGTYSWTYSTSTGDIDLTGRIGSK